MTGETDEPPTETERGDPATNWLIEEAPASRETVLSRIIAVPHLGHGMV